MTTQTENDNINDINENNQTITVIQESTNNEPENKQEELLPIDQKNDSTDKIEEKNNINDDTVTNPSLTSTAHTTDEQKEVTVNNSEDDNRSKKAFNSKIKYSSMSYHRSPYYTNGHPYGPAPYYYYQVPSVNEKPTPLMVIPTQSSSDNQTGNSTTVSPQNLPPRLRQTSASENDSNTQPSSSQVSTTSVHQPPAISGRRHRSILPRGTSTYFSPHPPPPLMATPPGVLFPYQPGHIAYNIRTPDELELLAFQQQLMNLPPPLIWPPPAAYPHFPPYPMYEPSPYIYNNSSPMNSNSSLLNPDAAEWVPISTDTEASSSDNQILIDDEINFPPLNTNRIEETNSEQKPQIDSSPEIDSINHNTDDNPIKNDSSSSQDDNKHLSSSKLTTITYSTVILQTPEIKQSNKTINTNKQQSSNSHPKQQRTKTRVSKDISSHRRQYPSNRNNYHQTRIEPPKPQQDDWIEVKSKKTKKFDRSFNDIQYENPSNVSHEQQTHQTLPLAGESTSEDEENKLVMIVENKTVTTATDYNQFIVDDIHRRLDNNERLVIIIRGCPGSGKSTLAKSINDGYNGQILSTDEHLFDSSKFDNSYDFNCRLASEAFKQNISPIIIDNTNITAWEMKPYVAMGKEANYDILLIEPQTPWRYKARELVKRNLHNLPLRRIKEMLNRFEHNVTVQSLIDQTKTNLFLPIVDQQQTDNESIDPVLTAKKSYEIIDDSNILDDVRLCINDMILFLTSSFYQTSLSISSSDLSFIPPSPPTPSSTPHSLFHRSLSRFSSTASQDHSFPNEHLLRLPTTSFSRCIENLTPPLSTNSSIIGKKRRKNKNKQQQANEILLNTNNNNNNDIVNEEDYNLPQSTYNVFLPEDSSDFVVIDEENNNDWLDNITQNFHLQRNSSWDHSSTIPDKKKSTNNKKNELLNIIHDELTKPSDQRPSSISINHIAIQCSPADFNEETTDSDRILIGHLSSSSTISPSIAILPGYAERGIQVDLNDDNNMYSLTHLIEFYSDLVSTDIIKQFYELCNSDIQLTQIQIDEYLQHSDIQSSIPTLRQLSFNALNQWNEQIKHSNPSFDTISIEDLLQDINDEENLILDNQTNNNSIELTNSNEMVVPWSMINSLQELYGELPTKSSFSYNTDGLSLPLDDDLSLSIYQALQRFLGIPNKITKPVNEKKLNKKINKQQWTPSTQNQSNKKTSNSPSLQEIMNEELSYMNTQKSTPKRSLDFASQHKLKGLEQHFPNISSDVIYDIFCANESDFDLTRVCISSMLDENASITIIPTSQPLPSLPVTIQSPITTKPIVVSYENCRHDARDHALKRKDCYLKADQANRHGMTGVASYYINQAREQTRLMKEANRIACEYVSQTKLNQFHQTHRLDLHELHADEALSLFKQIEQELNEGNKRTTAKSVEIVTGYGKNSPYGGGYGKIRSVILSYLRQKNYKYFEQNKGAILVQF